MQKRYSQVKSHNLIYPHLEERRWAWQVLRSGGKNKKKLQHALFILSSCNNKRALKLREKLSPKIIKEFTPKVVLRKSNNLAPL
jgi:hypothetical protein